MKRESLTYVVKTWIKRLKVTSLELTIDLNFLKKLKTGAEKKEEKKGIDRKRKQR